MEATILDYEISLTQSRMGRTTDEGDFGVLDMHASSNNARTKRDTRMSAESSWETLFDPWDRIMFSVIPTELILANTARALGMPLVMVTEDKDGVIGSRYSRRGCRLVSTSVLWFLHVRVGKVGIHCLGNLAITALAWNLGKQKPLVQQEAAVKGL